MWEKDPGHIPYYDGSFDEHQEVLTRPRERQSLPQQVAKDAHYLDQLR